MPTKRNPGKHNTLYRLKVPSGKGPDGQKQDRLTDANGRPLRDADYNHADNGTHTFPHYHDWIDGIRGGGYTVNEYGGKQYFS